MPKSKHRHSGKNRKTGHFNSQVKKQEKHAKRNNVVSIINNALLVAGVVLKEDFGFTPEGVSLFIDKTWGMINSKPGKKGSLSNEPGEVGPDTEASTEDYQHESTSEYTGENDKNNDSSGSGELRSGESGADQGSSNAEDPLENNDTGPRMEPSND